MAETGIAAIPAIGQFAAIIAEISIDVAIAGAKTIATYQDGVSQIYRIRKMNQISCGIGLKMFSSLTLARNQTWEATLAGTPGPLEWDELLKESEIDVYNLRNGYRSFAHCLPTGKKERPLNGETYQVSFMHPKIQGKRLSKRSSF